MPLNASRIDGKYILGPLQIGEVLEISVEPSPECYVEGVYEEARLKKYPASVDPSTGVGMVTVYPTYNASYTLLLHKYEKVYLIILADPPKCLVKVKSNKPVKELGKGYYRVGPWLIGGAAQDYGDLKLEIADECRFLRWEGAYEFTSLYQGLTEISGIRPEKNMTITALFENITTPQPPAGPVTTTQEGGGVKGDILATFLKLFQQPVGKALAAVPLIIAAGYASFKVVRWTKRKRQEKRWAREEALKTLCLMEKAAAAMRKDSHPWIGVFNLIARGYTLGDMAAGLANAMKIAEIVDSLYLTDEPRNVQQLIQLGDLIKSSRVAEEGAREIEEIIEAYEPALAGYLALIGAMPIGKSAEKLLDEAVQLANRFEALDKISRDAAVDGIIEEFSSLARKWIGSPNLQGVGRELKRTLEKMGLWDLCRRPPKRIRAVLAAIIGAETLEEYGFTETAAPTPVKEVEGKVGYLLEAVERIPPQTEVALSEAEKTCPKCGKVIPKKIWEKVTFCPFCGAELKPKPEEVREEQEVKKLEEKPVKESETPEIEEVEELLPTQPPETPTPPPEPPKPTTQIDASELPRYLQRRIEDAEIPLHDLLDAASRVISAAADKRGRAIYREADRLVNQYGGDLDEDSRTSLLTYVASLIEEVVPYVKFEQEEELERKRSVGGAGAQLKAEEVKERKEAPQPEQVATKPARKEEVVHFPDPEGKLLTPSKSEIWLIDVERWTALPSFILEGMLDRSRCTPISVERERIDEAVKLIEEALMTKIRVPVLVLAKPGYLHLYGKGKREYFINKLKGLIETLRDHGMLREVAVLTLSKIYEEYDGLGLPRDWKIVKVKIDFKKMGEALVTEIAKGNPKLNMDAITALTLISLLSPAVRKLVTRGRVESLHLGDDEESKAFEWAIKKIVKEGGPLSQKEVREAGYERHLPLLRMFLLVRVIEA